MSDVVFVLKSLAVTVVLITLMQIRVGSSTIENHAEAWIQDSIIVEGLRAVASGAIKVSREGYQAVSSLFSDKASKLSSDAGRSFEPGSRLERFKLRRSESYERQQEAKRRAQDHEEDPRD